MMFNCVELVTQQLRKFRATFASAVVASSYAKGRCLTDFEPVPSGATAVCMTAGGKRRQLAANCQRQKASYCDKFVAAFCRYLPPRFWPGFFRNDFVRGWCLVAKHFSWRFVSTPFHGWRERRQLPSQLTLHLAWHRRGRFAVMECSWLVRGCGLFSNYPGTCQRISSEWTRNRISLENYWIYRF